MLLLVDSGVFYLIRCARGIFLLGIGSFTAEMEQIRAQLRDVELDFARVPLIQCIEGREHFLLVFASVQSKNDVEYLRSFIVERIGRVSIFFTAADESMAICLNESLYFGPALLPVVLVDDLGHELLKVRLRRQLLLLLHLDVFGVVRRGELHA